MEKTVCLPIKLTRIHQAILLHVLKGFMIFKHEPIFPRRAIKLVKFRSNLLNCYAKKQNKKWLEKIV